MGNTTLASGEQVALPTFTSTADVLLSLQRAIQALNGLMTNFNPGGVIETYLEGVSLAVGNDASSYPGVTAPGVYEQLVNVQNAAFALTAQGISLDLKAADVGVTRKKATRANGPFQFFIVSPSATATVIPAGTLVSADAADPTAPPTVYALDTTLTILGSALSSPIGSITAVFAGAAGDAIAGAVNRVLSNASNVTGSNPQSISGGADIEQDDSPNGGLRSRTLSAIADASQGTIVALENDARSFPGVSDSVLIENTNDDGTRLDGRGQLYLDDGTGDLGNALNSNHAIIAVVQAAFDSGLFRAAGTQVHIVGSVLLPITITFVVQINQQYIQQVATLDAVLAAVQLSVFRYVSGIGIGKPVLVAEIVRYATEVPGVSNVVVGTVVINGLAGDLIPTATQVPRLTGLGSVALQAQLVTF